MTLNAAFMGSPDFAVQSLQVVARRCNLRVVVCQPDRPAGRGRKLTPPAVKIAAEPLGVPIIQPRKMKDGTLAEALRQYDLDVAVVVAFGRIIPPDILAIPRYGCINVHGSILPKWRGAAPIQRAVLAGDAQTGVAIMAMDAGLDTGAVYRIAKTAIGPLETSAELFSRLATLGAETLDAFLADFPDLPAPTPQDDAAATHAPPLAKAEGHVDWSRTVERVVNHVRGMDPWPTAFTHRQSQMLKLFGARPSTLDRTGRPGEVVAADDDGLHVACLDGLVCVQDVQPPGKRRMKARAYVAGRPFASGECLGPDVGADSPS